MVFDFLSLRNRFLLASLLTGLVGMLADGLLVKFLSGFSGFLVVVAVIAGSIGWGLLLASPVVYSMKKIKDSSGELARSDAAAHVEHTVLKEFRPFIKDFQEAREKFHWYVAILDAIPYPISVTDINMNWTFINKPVEQFLGVSRKDVQGKACRNWNAAICGTEQCGIARLRQNQLQTLFEQQGRHFEVDSAYILNSRGEKAGHIEAVREITNKVRVYNFQKRQVESVAGALQKMAQGDLTASIQVDKADDHTRDVRDNFLKIGEHFKAAVERISEAMEQVMASAEQMNSAAAQINAGSQQLSQSASSQASSIEEVSSSLQELDSMSKNNALNAKGVQQLCETAREITIQSSESMQQLSEAMDRIKESSDSTSRIVKTIDEIAFQTNLLALNAAVEAARAGDAGKGFAVVAEEVRNLAIRSAEAAKNTAELIEGSVKNATTGVEINRVALANLQAVTQQVIKVSEMVAEIAAASDQQSAGVGQITTAVEQMSHVTQAVAANAQESAGAAAEMSSQASELQSNVSHFRLK